MNVLMPKKSQCAGLTLFETLVAIGILIVLAAIFLPAMRTGMPEAARRTQCMNNLRQIALATLNYESAHMKFPAATGMEAYEGIGSSGQINGLVAILPFMEEKHTHDAIVKHGRSTSDSSPAFPMLHDKDFEPWKVGVGTFRCPSLMKNDGDGLAQIHYGLCIGDRARNIATPENLRGGFAGSLRASFDDIVDGASNSIMIGEIGSNEYRGELNPYAVNQPSLLLTNPSKCFELIESDDPESWEYRGGVHLSPIGRGGHWADGRAGIALFNTILPPKSPSAAIKGSVGVDGIYSASGPHSKLVCVAFLDASAHSISIDISAGDSSSSTPTKQEIADKVPSPYGVWGALGTINGGDVANDY